MKSDDLWRFFPSILDKYLPFKYNIVEKLQISKIKNQNPTTQRYYHLCSVYILLVIFSSACFCLCCVSAFLQNENALSILLFLCRDIL